MKKIAFLAQKGGSGKTTLAVHTAVAATEAGESVVVIDTDPQKSATVWGDARSQEAPIVATAAASELGRVLEAADQERMTLAIVDTAPHAAPDATRIVRAVDLVAIPVRPTLSTLPPPAVPSISSKRPAFAPCSSYRPARSDPLKSQKPEPSWPNMACRSRRSKSSTVEPSREPWPPAGP